MADLCRPGERRARDQPDHPRERLWEPERAEVWVPKRTQSPPPSRKREEGVGLVGPKPVDQKNSPPKEGGDLKDEEGDPEGCHRRRRRRSRKNKEVPGPSGLRRSSLLRKQGCDSQGETAPPRNRGPVSRGRRGDPL